MKTAQLIFPLTLEQSQMLAAALDIQFKSDFLGSRYNYNSSTTKKVSRRKRRRWCLWE